MSGNVKIVKKNRDGRLAYASFFENLSQVHINPLHRNDFMGELVSQSELESEWPSNTVSSHITDTLCEISVMNDTLNVLYTTRDEKDMNPKELKSLSGTSQDLERLDRYIYQYLRSTYFNSALRYWKSRVSNKDFMNLYTQLVPLCQSLPRLLYSSHDLIHRLIEEIETPHSMAQEPAYHLLAILSRDLNKDFIKFLPFIFDRLIRRVESQNIFILEMTFFTLAYFLRVLSSWIVSDLKSYVKYFRPVLAHHGVHVRSFSSEALSFLLRRCPINILPYALHSLFEVFLENLETTPFLAPTKCPSKVEWEEELLRKNIFDKEKKCEEESTENKLFEKNTNEEEESTENKLFEKNTNEEEESTENKFFEKNTNEEEESTEKKSWEEYYKEVKGCRKQQSQPEKEEKTRVPLGDVSFPSLTHSKAEGCLSHSFSYSVYEKEEGGSSSPHPIYMAESLGLTFFYVVKNINKGFTSKLPIILDFISSHLLTYITGAMRQSRVETVKSTYTVFLSTFFLQCRNHGEIWTSVPCTALQGLVDENCKQWMNDLLKENMSASLSPRLVSLAVLLRTLTNVICCTPRPKEEPVVFLTMLWSTLCHFFDPQREYLLKRSIDEHWPSEILDTLLGVMSTLLFHTPHQADLLCLMRQTFRNLSTLIQKLSKDSGLTHKKDIFQVFIVFSFKINQTALSYVEKKPDACLQLPSDDCCLFVLHLIRLLKDDALHYAAVSLMLQFLDLFPCVLLLDISFKDMDWSSCLCQLASMSSFVCQTGTDNNLSDINIHKRLLCYASLFKRLVYDMKCVSRETLESILFSHQELHLFLLSQVQYLLSESRWLTELSHLVDEHALERLGCFLASVDCFLCIASRLPKGSDYLFMLTESNETPSKEKSLGSQLFSWTLKIWTLMFEVHEICPWPRKTHTRVLLSEAMTKWFLHLMEIFPDALINQHLYCGLHSLLYGVLLTVSYLGRQRRLELLSWLGRLSDSELCFLSVTFNVLVHHTESSACLFPKRLSSQYFSIHSLETMNTDKEQRTHESVVAAAHSLLVDAESLEKCDLSLDLERNKKGYIASLSHQTFALLCLVKKLSWLIVFSFELLFCQYSEKFLPLWSATYSAFEELLNHLRDIARVPQTVASLHTSSPLLCSPFSTQQSQLERKSSDGVQSSCINVETFYAFLCGTLLQRMMSCVGESLESTAGQPKRGSTVLSAPMKKGSRKNNLISISVVPTSLELSQNSWSFSTLVHTLETQVGIKMYDVHISTTDPQTLHQWCSKSLHLVITQWLGQLGGKLPLSCCGEGILDWILTMSLIHVHALCGIQSKSFQLKFWGGFPAGIMTRPMVDKEIRASFFSQGGLGRLLDLLRIAFSLNRDLLKKLDTTPSHNLVDSYDQLLNDCFYRGLLVPEQSFQRLCLQCFFSRFPQYNSYLSFFTDVVMDVNLSRTLVHFCMDSENSIVAQDHRSVVVPLLCRILVSKLSKKTLQGGSKRKKGDLRSRRRAIFRFLSQLNDDEIPIVVTSIFSSILTFYSHSSKSFIICEAQKYDHLLDFFRHINNQTFTQPSKATKDQVKTPLHPWQWSPLKKADGCIVLHVEGCFRASYLISFVLNLDEMINQLRLKISRLIVFFFQFVLALIDWLSPTSQSQPLNSLSVISQTSSQDFMSEEEKSPSTLATDNKEQNTSLITCPWSGSHDKLVMRTLFKLLKRLTLFASEEDLVAFDETLWHYEKRLHNSLCVSLESGARSSVVEFIFFLGTDPRFFFLLKSSLRFTLPILANAIASQPILSAVRKGRPTPDLCGAVLSFFLRLCRGGYVSLDEATKDVRLMEKTNKSTYSRKKRRRDHDSSNESSEDSLSDLDELHHGSQSLYHQWKNQVQLDCEEGIEIIRPFCVNVLNSFILLLKERKSASHLVKRQNPNTWLITNEELDCLIVLQHYVPDYNVTSLDVIAQLIDALPSSRKLLCSPAYVTRQKQFYLCLYEHLVRMERVYDEHVDTCQHILQSVKKTCGEHLQFLQDLDLRHTVAKLLLLCALLEASCRHVKETLEAILTSRPKDLESFLQNDASTNFLNTWLPCQLFSQKWIPSCHQTHDQLWAVTAAILVVMLTSLKQRSMSVDLDDSLCCVLLSDIVQHGMILKNQDIHSLSSTYIRAHYQTGLINQCLFLLQAPEIDSSVRVMAQKVIHQVINRIGDVTLLREKLSKSPHHTHVGTNTDSLEDPLNKICFEWQECHITFHTLFYSVITTLRYMLISHNVELQRSSLLLFSHTIKTLYPLREWLPFITESVDYFECPAQHPHYEKNKRLISERFHFDLAHLVPSCNTLVVREEHQDLLGDVFQELTHMQKHRQAKGLLLLTKSMASSSLTKTTARWICLSVAFTALVQRELVNVSSQHVGLLESAMKCLTEAARVVGWTSCIHLIIRLGKHFQKGGSKSKIVARTLCGVVEALGVYLDEHVSNYLEKDEEKEKMMPQSPFERSSSPPFTDSDSTASGSDEVLQGNHESEVERDKILSMQKTVRVKLLPFFRHLSFPSRPKNSTPDEGIQKKTEKKNELSPIVIHPQLVAAQLQLLKLLPRTQFLQALPKLLETLVGCLRSQCPDTRRKGRTAVCSIVSSLGPNYTPFIFKYFSQYLVKGYQVSVLLFTLTAALMEMVFGGSKRGKALTRSPTRIHAGLCDAVIPVVLPLIDQELTRFCDPGRPEFQHDIANQEPAPKRPGIDEERYFKSSELILILSRIASYEAILQHLLPYLKGLLLGEVYCQVILSPTTSSFKKYHHMVEHLFDQVVVGLHANTSLSLEQLFFITLRFLRLHSIILNQELSSKGALPTKKGSSSRPLEDLNNSDDEFIRCFLSNQQHSQSTETQQQNPLQTTYYKDKTFSIQLGAAIGRSVEQMMKVKHPLDLQACGELYGLGGLRLFLLLLQKFQTNSEWIKKVNLCGTTPIMIDTPPHDTCLSNVPLEKELTKEILTLFRRCTFYTIQCFCGEEDRLRLLSSKALIKLIHMGCIDVEKDGRRISTIVFRLFKEAMEKAQHKVHLDHVRSMCSLSVKLLAALLVESPNVKWFHRAIKDYHSTNMATFKTALLTQIRDSLNHTPTRIPALELLRRLLLVNQKTTVLNEPENCALVYQCMDEVGMILIQQTYGVQKHINLCGTIYVDFLMHYPMPERIQKRRIDLLIRNLDYPQSQGRQAILVVLYHLTNRLPVKILIQRYATVLAVALTLRLVKETHRDTRLMTRTILKNLFKNIGVESSIPSLLDVMAKVFLQHPQLVCRAAFLECLELFLSCLPGPLSPEHSLHYLEWVMKIILFDETKELKGESQSALLNTPHDPSDQTWKLPFTFLRFWERFLNLHLNTLQHFVTNAFASPIFLPLWQYFVFHCAFHRHPWIKLTSLRILTYVLNEWCKNVENQCLMCMFSSECLSELPVSKKQKLDQEDISPLTALLFYYVNEIPQSETERLGYFAEILVNGITALCKTLLETLSWTSTQQNLNQHSSRHPDQQSTSRRSNHEKVLQLTKNNSLGQQNTQHHATWSSLDCIPNVDTSCGRELFCKDGHIPTKVSDSQKICQRSLCNTTVQPSLKKIKHLTVSTKEFPKACDGYEDSVGCVRFSPLHQQGDKHDKNDPERQDKKNEPEHQSEEKNEDEKDVSEKDIPEDQEQSEEEEAAEDILEMKQDLSTRDVKLLESRVLSGAEDVYSRLFSDCEQLDRQVMCDVNTSMSCHTNNNLTSPCLILWLKASRIKWTIGKLMWIIKRGTGKLTDNVVRICLALSILKNILHLLPLNLFNEPDGVNLLSHILEATYTCSSLLRKTDPHSHFHKNTMNDIAALCQTTLKDQPKSLTGMVCYFAAEIMDHIEKYFDANNMSVIFFNCLHKVKKMVGSRRVKRKQQAKCLRVKNPQKAALKKILRHEKKKRTRKQRIS